MASPIGSSGSSPQAQPLLACHTVLMGRNLARIIFSYLLADQKTATRNLKIDEDQQMGLPDPRDPRKRVVKLEMNVKKPGKAEKELIDARELKEGTRNMEVARSVCREWNKIILTDRELHFFLIFTRAKRIFVEHIKEYGFNSGPVRQIARLESLWDPASALSTLKWISDDELVQMVRKAVSLNELVNAKNMANAIKNLEQKIIALCEIAKIDPQVLQEAKDLVPEFDPKRDSMLLEIAKVEALQDLATVEATVNGIKFWNLGKAKIYVELAKVAAHQNPEAVKTWACQIEDPKIQALVQFEIAIIECDPISASKWLDYIAAEKIKGNAELARAYIQIANFQAVRSTDRSLTCAKAKECISSLRRDFEKVELLIEIAELDENPNFTEAKQEAALAPFSSLRNVRFHNHDENYYLGGDYQFRQIALAEAKYDLEAAKATADKIVDPTLKVKTKYDIEMISGDIDKAKAAASEIWDPLEKALAFIKIARKDPLHDLSEAKDLACRFKGQRSCSLLPSVPEKVSLICSIAEVILEFPMDHYVWRFKIPPKKAPQVPRKNYEELRSKGFVGF